MKGKIISLNMINECINKDENLVQTLEKKIVVQFRFTRIASSREQ